jgi:hypothetical protein
MPYRKLLQTDEFAKAVGRSGTLNWDQQAQMMSALASLGKDGTSLDGHDWVEVATLEGGPENTMKVTVWADEDTCWCAAVMFDDASNALVVLYASPGASVDDTAMAKIWAEYDLAKRALEPSQPIRWR